MDEVTVTVKTVTVTLTVKVTSFGKTCNVDALRHISHTCLTIPEVNFNLLTQKN